MRLSQLLPVVVLLSGWTCVGQAAPLSFSQTLELAEQHSARLKAQAARLYAAEAMARPAAALPDPQFFVGLENVPVSGPDRGSLSDDFMTVQTVGFMQAFPALAKRKARKAQAMALIDQERVLQRLEQRQVRRAAGTDWIRLYFVEKKLALLEALTQENELFADTITSQLATGRAQPADALLPRREAVDLEDRRDELNRDRHNAIIKLQRWIGIAADDGIVGEPTILTIDPDGLRHHLEAQPDIALFEAKTRLAQAKVRKAAADKAVDWGVELAYGHRGETFNDMVSLQFTVDLPVLPQQRQDPVIAAKRSELARVAAERENTLRMHTATLEGQLAEHELLKRRSERMRRQWLPLSQENIELQLAGYRAGTVPLTDVLKARRDAIEQRFKAIALEKKRLTLAAQLQLLYGDDQP